MNNSTILGPINNTTILGPINNTTILGPVNITNAPPTPVNVTLEFNVTDALIGSITIT